MRAWSSRRFTTVGCFAVAVYLKGPLDDKGEAPSGGRVITLGLFTRWLSGCAVIWAIYALKLQIGLDSN